MQTLKSQSKENRGTAIRFAIVRTYTGGPNIGKNYTSNLDVFKTEQDAKNAAKSMLTFWGSNLVYLGCNPVNIDNIIYFKNSFNVWD